MGIKLKKHNEEVYQRVSDMLEEEKKAAVIQPTGTGKTYIALKLIEETKGRTIFVAPSAHILNQVKETIENARISGEISEEEYRRYQEVQYVTYSGLMELSKIEGGYENIILDELHRCGAPEWGKGVKRLLEKSGEAKVLGLTATPKRAVDNRDMALELFGENIASEMTLEEAVAEGIIQAPTYISAIYSLQKVIIETESRIEKIEDEGKKKELRKKLQEVKKSLGKAEGIEEIFKKYASKPDGKYIVFCNDIKDMHKKMEEASRWFSKVGDTRLYEVSYKKSEELNEDTIKRFREEGGKINLLFTVDKLNEGIHIDGIDGVIMLRSTKSPIIYMQQLGRALSAGNEGTPLVFDLVNNIESSRYSGIEEFKERVERIQRERGIDREEIDNIKIIDLQREVREVLEEINSKLERTRGGAIAETLRIAKILSDNGVDLRRLKLSRKVDGKDVYIRLSEIEQEGIDIQKIIEENGLDGKFKLGQSIKVLRGVYNGKMKSMKMTKEERRQAEKIEGLLEKEGAIAKTLRIAKILSDNGVDFTRLKVSRKVDGKQVTMLLSEIEQEGIDIQKIIEENGLDGTFNWGGSITRLRRVYNGTIKGQEMENEERKMAEELGLVQKEKPESAIAITLRIAKILSDNGIDLAKFKSSKTVDKKTVYIQLLDIEQEGIDIQKIIEENGLDGTFNWGGSITRLRGAYNGTAKGIKMTDEEKRYAEELGLVQKEKPESAIAITLRIAKILSDNGIDLAKFKSSKTVDKKTVFIQLSEIEQEGIDIQKIIEENGLDGTFNWGGSITRLRGAYNGTAKGIKMTDEEKRYAEELGLIKENSIAKTLRIVQILSDNGVDFTRLKVSRKVDGKQVCIQLSEIEQEGIDIQKIIDENGLDGTLKLGKSIKQLRSVYSGTSTTQKMTEEERMMAEELGLISKELIEKRRKLEELVQTDAQRRQQVEEARKLEAEYEEQLGRQVKQKGEEKSGE